jgi:hypothetical protein
MKTPLAYVRNAAVAVVKYIRALWSQSRKSQPLRAAPTLAETAETIQRGELVNAPLLVTSYANFTPRLLTDEGKWGEAIGGEIRVLGVCCYTRAGQIAAVVQFGNN